MNKGQLYLRNAVRDFANEGAQQNSKGTEMEVSICPVAHLGAMEAGIAEILACYILLTCCRMGLKAAVACVALGNDALEIQFVEDMETAVEQ